MARSPRYGRDNDAKPKPRNDAYTGLLAISFFAMLVGCALLAIDYLTYGEQKPAVAYTPPPLKGAQAKVPGDPPPPKKEDKVEKKEEKKDEDKKDDKKDEKKDEKKDDKKDEKKDDKKDEKKD